MYLKFPVTVTAKFCMSPPTVLECSASQAEKTA